MTYAKEEIAQIDQIAKVMLRSGPGAEAAVQQMANKEFSISKRRTRREFQK